MLSTRVTRGIGIPLVLASLVTGTVIAGSPVAQAEDADRYWMTNKTDQPVSMDFKVQVGKPETGIGYPPDHPQIPGDTTSALFPRPLDGILYNKYMMGDFCYGHKNWNWQRAEENTYNHFEIWNASDRFHAPKIEIHRYYLAQGRADRPVWGPSFALNEGKPC